VDGSITRLAPADRWRAATCAPFSVGTAGAPQNVVYEDAGPHGEENTGPTSSAAYGTDNAIAIRFGSKD